MFALLAIVFLALGIRFRPAEREQTSEAVAAELLTSAVTAAEPAGMSRFFATRAAELGRRVKYSQSIPGNVLLWNDTLQFVSSSTAPVLVARVAPDTTKDTLSSSRSFPSSAWTLLLARNADDSLIWAVTLQQGTTSAECAGSKRDEIVLAAAPAKSFVGAGVFSPNGKLRGAVVNCGDRLAAITRASLDEWIAELATRRDSVVDSTKSRNRR